MAVEMAVAIKLTQTNAVAVAIKGVGSPVMVGNIVNCEFYQGQENNLLIQQGQNDFQFM